ncbi:MAG: glycosyltransferase [Chloroflexi bacterium]|nr:glycosyltransferase [Chloroflexota bacterium]
MKIVQVNYYDKIGGAGRAAYRLHRALLRAGVQSRMLVKEMTEPDWSVQSLAPHKAFFPRLNRRLVFEMTAQFKTASRSLHSPDMPSSVSIAPINAGDADLVNLHWFNGGMLSISDVAKINKPLVWTLHDMWAFCGAEHVTFDTRWKDGYRNDNRPAHESGFDLNRWTWERKRKHWRRPIQLVAPSHWLADCVRQSALMRAWSVVVIPNAIDTDLWRPLEKGLARRALDLPPDIPLLAFGAAGGDADPNKGFDLLTDALAHLQGEIAGLELVIFGQNPPPAPPHLGFPTHYMGQLRDDLSLRLLYNASDVLVIPSRLENLPNTGVEAHACGTPIAAFHTGGLPDIVEHLKTGYLAKPYDTLDLAKGIKWILDQKDDDTLSRQSRKRAVERFGEDNVAKQYITVYAHVLDGSPSA